jgi:hypothetical protein
VDGVAGLRPLCQSGGQVRSLGRTDERNQSLLSGIRRTVADHRLRLCPQASVTERPVVLPPARPGEARCSNETAWPLVTASIGQRKPGIWRHWQRTKRASSHTSHLRKAGSSSQTAPNLSRSSVHTFRVRSGISGSLKPYPAAVTHRLSRPSCNIDYGALSRI